MPGVSKEQIAAAKQMTAIEFLRRFRPNELVRSGSRGEFQLREHDSSKSTGSPPSGIGKAGISEGNPLWIISSKWKG